MEGGWGISTVRAGYCWAGHGDKTLALGAGEEMGEIIHENVNNFELIFCTQGTRHKLLLALTF